MFSDSKLLAELRPFWPAYGTLIVFSFFITIANLTTPIFMMQLSDRVLLSKNELTLVFLAIIALFIIAVTSVLESVRTRVLQRVGFAFYEGLSAKVFDALHRHSERPSSASNTTIMADVNVLREAISGPTVAALFDLMWMPISLVALFLIHPVFGALGFGIVIIVSILTVMNQLSVRSDGRRSQEWQAHSSDLINAIGRNTDVARALGMLPFLAQRWHRVQKGSLGYQARAMEKSSIFTTITRFIRTSQQIIILSAGAILYIERQIGPGAMFAAMMITIRGIGPVEMVVSGWRIFVNGSAAFERLDTILQKTVDQTARMSLPRPTGQLTVTRIVAVPPGRDQVVVNDVSFKIARGHVLGIVGPSGAGKSALAKLLVGIWKPRRGLIALDDHDLSHWNPDELGRHLGYMPQDVELLPGTIAENIARFYEHEPDHAAVLEATEIAGVQDIIQSLPNGFNTKVGTTGPESVVLSGGQRQRLALARAVYGLPSLVVLDEPNSNLDSAGEQCLGRAVSLLRNRGSTVVIVTHRVNMLVYCDDVLVMNAGGVQAFGSRDQIMSRIAPVKPAMALEATA